MTRIELPHLFLTHAEFARAVRGRVRRRDWPAPVTIGAQEFFLFNVVEIWRGAHPSVPPVQARLAPHVVNEFFSPEDDIVHAFPATADQCNVLAKAAAAAGVDEVQLLRWLGAANDSTVLTAVAAGVRGGGELPLLMPAFHRLRSCPRIEEFIGRPVRIPWRTRLTQ